MAPCFRTLGLYRATSTAAPWGRQERADCTACCSRSQVRLQAAGRAQISLIPVLIRKFTAMLDQSEAL